MINTQNKKEKKPKILKSWKSQAESYFKKWPKSWIYIIGTLILISIFKEFVDKVDNIQENSSYFSKMKGIFKKIKH